MIKITKLKTGYELFESKNPEVMYLTKPELILIAKKINKMFGIRDYKKDMEKDRDLFLGHKQTTKKLKQLFDLKSMNPKKYERLALEEQIQELLDKAYVSRDNKYIHQANKLVDKKNKIIESSQQRYEGHYSDLL